jgi:hypothetical protein
MSLENIENDFKDLIIDFIYNLSKICPNSSISNNIIIIDKFIKNEPIKIIELFIKYVLKYKKYIDNEDENFFLSNCYSEDIKDNNDFVKVFEFKNIWKNLDNNDKKNIMKYMKYLCDLSYNYFIIKYK